MPTRQELESALRNAHKAGDTEAAKKLANALKSTPEDTIASRTDEKLREDVRGMSGPDVRLIAMGSAVNDVLENLDRLGMRAGQAFGVLGEEDIARNEKRLSADDEAFNRLREERPVNTAVGRGLAQAGMFAAVPGGASGNLAARSATGALAGGTTAAISSGVGEDPYESFAIGATFGAMAPAVAGGISRAINRFAKKPIQVIRDGKFTDDAIELLKKQDISPDRLTQETARELRKAGALTKEQAERFNLFQEFDPGFNPTQAQVTQRGEDFIRQQELAKGSNAIRSTLDNQERIIAEKVDDLATALGGRAVDNVDAGISIANITQGRINSADDAVSAAYQAVRDNLPGEKVISPKGLVAQLRKFAPQDKASDGLVSAIWGDLKQRGLITKSGKIQGRVSADVAEEIRKNINAIASENPQARSRIARELKNALDDDVGRAVGDDLFKPARDAKARLERSLERTRATRRDVGKRTLLEDIVENRANPDDLVTKIMRRSTRTDDVDQLMSFLKSGSPEERAAGQEAISELRSAIIRELYQKAASGKTEAGGLMFSGKAFAKELDKIGGEKLRAIFEPETLSQLGMLRRIGELRTPVQGTALGLGPSGQGAMEVRNTIIDAADEATGRFLRLSQKLLGARKDLSEIKQLLQPAQTTEAALRASQRIRARPMPGAVGAVTADRLQEGNGR